MVFWLGMKKKVLRRWYHLTKETPRHKHIDMVDENIPGNTFKIDPERMRVEKRSTYHRFQASSTIAKLDRSGSRSNGFEDEEKVIKVSFLKGPCKRSQQHATLFSLVARC